MTSAPRDRASSSHHELLERKTVRQQPQANPESLLHIANFGAETLEEVYAALEQYGYYRPWVRHKAPVIYPRYLQFLALKTRGLSLIMAVINSGTVPELVRARIALHWAVDCGIER